MAPCEAVKVLDQCKVAPPPGSVAAAVADIPLTFFDQLWLPLPPPQCLYFYDYPYPQTLITQSLIPQLKLSLSCTLIHFYPLAGNLSWPHDSYRPIIRYVDRDSVSLTIAESNADFKSLSSDHVRDVIESHALVPHLPASGPVVPVFAIQLTVFPNSGISIGITNSHSFIDGRSISHFMNTWALISKLGDAAKSVSTQSPPFLDRTVIKDPIGIEKMYLNELERFMAGGTDHESVSGIRSLRVMDINLKSDMFRATFKLSPTDVKRLKDWILARRRCNKDEQQELLRISTYVVTCAFVWICLLKAEAEAAKLSKPSSNYDLINSAPTRFVMNVDCRSRMEMDPPIPGTYFGNCIRPFWVTTERSNLLREDGVVVASKLIEEAIRKLVDKGVLRGLEDGVSDLLRVESGRVIAAAGSPRFGFYGVDFGWGKPKKVEFVSNDRTGSVFMKESRNSDGGVEIDLVLDKKEMDVFASAFTTCLKSQL